MKENEYLILILICVMTLVAAQLLDALVKLILLIP